MKEKQRIPLYVRVVYKCIHIYYVCVVYTPSVGAIADIHITNNNVKKR